MPEHLHLNQLVAVQWMCKILAAVFCTVEMFGRHLAGRQLFQQISLSAQACNLQCSTFCACKSVCNIDVSHAIVQQHYHGNIRCAVLAVVVRRGRVAGSRRVAGRGRVAGRPAPHCAPVGLCD